MGFSFNLLIQGRCFTGTTVQIIPSMLLQCSNFEQAISIEMHGLAFYPNCSFYVFRLYRYKKGIFRMGFVLFNTYCGCMFMLPQCFVRLLFAILYFLNRWLRRKIWTICWCTRGTLGIIT